MPTEKWRSASKVLNIGGKPYINRAMTVNISMDTFLKKALDHRPNNTLKECLCIHGYNPFPDR